VVGEDREGERRRGDGSVGYKWGRYGGVNWWKSMGGTRVGRGACGNVVGVDRYGMEMTAWRKRKKAGGGRNN